MAFLTLIAIHPKNYARPILSFKARSTTFYAEFDSSFKGLGVVILTITNQVWTTYRVISIDTPYLLYDNCSYQNTMELTAMVFAVCVIRSLGHSDLGVDLSETVIQHYPGENMKDLAEVIVLLELFFL